MMIEMETPTITTQRADLRDFLAAERTFLAWIRTGLALMGFGFVVARFGLFLRQLELGQHIFPGRSQGLSLWFGTALILLGVVVSALSSRDYLRLVRELQHGQLSPSRPSFQAVLIALFLALIGLGMAIYLVSLRSSANMHSKINEEVSVAQAAGKKVTLFALVDHSGEADKVGMKMPLTKLLIFGNPKAGTPVTLAALALPLARISADNCSHDLMCSYGHDETLPQRS